MHIFFIFFVCADRNSRICKVVIYIQEKYLLCHHPKHPNGYNTCKLWEGKW